MISFNEYLSRRELEGFSDDHMALASKMNRLGVDVFKKICKSFGLQWKIENGDLLVGSSFRPGASDVGSEIASQATKALEDVPGGEVVHVVRGMPGEASPAHLRYLQGVKDGIIYVRKKDVDPDFLETLSRKLGNFRT